VKKIADSPTGALNGLLRDGMTIMTGGFGLCGIPSSLIGAIRESAVRGLTVISNNAGIDGVGLGQLLETGQVSRMIASYVGENKLFAAQYLNGTLDVEFVPQGTLAEKIRAGGAGIPAFYSRVGAATDVARGKETRVFGDTAFVLEQSLFADLALIHAHRGDGEGNLVYRMTARNFNPIMATAAGVTVAEVEHLVAPGAIDSDHVMTPGIFVDRIVEVRDPVKYIEQRTVRVRSHVGADS
jgi:3-oxoacid CoA-transferase subunit A